MESFGAGWSTSCIVAECVECADVAVPSGNTHGDFICDERYGRIQREGVWI